MSNSQDEQSSKNTNEISLRIKIDHDDENKTIYFLDNTENPYYESEKEEIIQHKHDNLSELNKKNTTLIIDEQTVPFKKFFIPSENRIYSIKLLFKSKLSSCAYMFCDCENIIEIDFSKFSSENVNDMQYMFSGCSSLTSVNLSSFNTE